MLADAMECNGECERQKVEVEGKVGLGVAVEGDRKGKENRNGIARREGEESGGDGSEGSFVMVNDDSDGPAERDLDLGGKVGLVDAKDSSGAPANVGPTSEEMALGDREPGGENGGDSEVCVDSVVTGEEDRKDETAVGDAAEEERMESETITAVEVGENKEKEIKGQGDSESNNGAAHNEVELEEEHKDETIAVETDLRVEPESLAEAQVKSETATKETDDQSRSEPTVEQVPETLVAEIYHQAELKSASEVEDRQAMETKDQLESGSAAVEEKQEAVTTSAETVRQEEAKSEVETVITETEHQLGLETAVEVPRQDALTATRGTCDQVKAESAVVAETQEPQIVLTETNGQEQSEVVVPKEEKQEPMTLVSETKDQAELQSAVEVEMKEDTEAAVDQAEPEAIVIVGEEQEPEIVVTVTAASEYLPAEPEAIAKVGEEQKPEIVITGTVASEYLPAEPEAIVKVGEEQKPEIVVTETAASEYLPAEPEAIMKVGEEQKPEIVITETAASEYLPAESEAIVKVGEEQKPEIVVTETAASEYLPVEHEEVRLSNAAEEGQPDECVAANATASEPPYNTSLQKADSIESSETHEASSISQLDGTVMEAESSGDLESSKNSSVCHVDDKELLKEVKVSNKSAENGETNPSETESGIRSADESGPLGPVSGADQNSEIINASFKSGVEAENVLVQSRESMAVCSKTDSGPESKVCNDAEIQKDVSTNHAVAIESDSRTGNDSAESGELLASSVKGDQATKKNDDEEHICDEVEAVKVIQAIPEDPSGSALDGDRVDAQVAKWQPCYIIRVPRFTDEGIWMQIQHAQLDLEEKTRSRESIRVSLQKKRANCNEYREKLEAAKAKEKATRAACIAKRQEIESVQSMLNKLKNATSIEEIDNQIEAMDREFQHSTMGLKEEKQHLHDIKQLKQRREQLSSNMVPKSEIDVAFDQRDQIEERFKTLKKELDSLKADLSAAEMKGKEAWKEYDDEVQHWKDLQGQFRTADEIRQKAYGHWRSLKNESIEKSKYFYMYKNEQKAAANYVSSGDREGLWLHCSKQVEKIMELWNNNDEFRMQYVKFNMNSTLRRLKTSDGRSLGPDEEPPALRTTVDKSSRSVSNSSNINPPVAIISSEAKPEKLGTLAAPKEESFPALQTAQRKQSKSKKSTKPTSKETATVTIPDGEEVEAAPKESSRSKEEEEQARKAKELARKEEELRKEKAEAEMKEQLRLEQKAKAKEAEERKRRKTEKTQARAEYRAQKEAELRDKKKLKKEKRKAAAASDTANGEVGDNAPATESSPHENAPESDNPAVTASKRPSKPPVTARQYNKTQPLPLPLRNRGKRKMRTWMWLALATLLVLALFWAGNYINLSFSLP